jgi:hypothetical protein
MKVTAKVLEDRTFHGGRYLTLEFPDEPPAREEPPEPAPEEHRGSRAPDLPDQADPLTKLFRDPL